MPIFQSPPAKFMLICQKKVFMKKCYFPLNLPPFDAEVAEKFLNGIYYGRTKGRDGDVLLISGPKTSHIKKNIMEFQDLKSILLPY